MHSVRKTTRRKRSLMPPLPAKRAYKRSRAQEGNDSSPSLKQLARRAMKGDRPAMEQYMRLRLSQSIPEEWFTAPEDIRAQIRARFQMLLAEIIDELLEGK